MRSPVIEQHLQTRLPPGNRRIPPPLVGRPRPRPAHDPERRAAGDRQDQTGRNGRAPTASGHADRCPVGAENLDRNGHWMDKRWRRGWEVAWPRCRVPVTGRDHGGPASRADAPGCSLPDTSRASRLGVGGSGATVLPGFLTPRYETDLFAWPPPARAHGCQDGLVTEKALDSRQSPFHLSACAGCTTSEVHLASVVGHCTGDREPQHGDPGSGGGDHWSLQPSLELPPDPVHHGAGGERAVPSPTTL